MDGQRKLNWMRRNGRLAACSGLTLAALYLGAPSLLGQGRLTEPVYRVAATNPAEPAGQSPPAATAPLAVRPAAAEVAAPAPFDLAQQPGEHPLAPVIRVCKSSLAHVNKNVTDYSCRLVKMERLPDEPRIGEPQIIDLRVRHEPFSVHLSFLKPHTGRKVVWVKGQNEDKLTVREAGLASLVGRLDLHPESTTAMSGQKYPIYRIGIRNLLAELVQNFEADTKFAESEVTTNPKAEIFNRSATLIQVTHPVPRQNFRSHIARIFFDNELRVPIYYDAYLWPAKEGDQPPMEESYAYRDLKLNNGFTARDFDKENAEIFR
jgi:hypothetical protein